MELTEPIERINELLSREFGHKFNKPEWRVVLAGEQFEKRVMEHTDEGLELLTPEVRTVRKYQHIKPDRYVLEREVPVQGETDLVTKTSYEPAWTFEDRHGNYLPPRFDACKVIIESIYGSVGLNYIKKDKNMTAEAMKAEIDRMEELLFGNETPVGDALAHGYGVVVPGPKEIQ